MSDGGAEAALAPPAHTSEEDGGASGRSRVETAGLAGALVLALIPVVRMALLVRSSAVLQYSDYWLLLPHYTNPDGGLRWAGLFEFEFQNHPVVVPMLVYWLNLHFFAGSNVALGVFVLLLGIGLLALVGLVLRRSDLRPVDQMVLFVLASCLIFTPNGAWNYGIAMSGTAWLGAGLIGVGAVYLRSRDRPVLAFAAATLAVFTYATGLMVWPGVVAAGLCRRPPREWWRELPFVAGFVATYLWYKQVQTTGLEADLPWPNVLDGGRLLARLLAFPFGATGTLAEWIGGVLLVGTVALVVWGILWSRSKSAAMWVGIAVFGLLATLSLAFGRYTFITYFGNSNRYTSVPTVALIGSAGLLITAIQEHRERQPAASPRTRADAFGWVALGAFSVGAIVASVTGGPHLDDMRKRVSDQELREIALHLDIADRTRYLAGYETSVTDLLVHLDHHPFNGGWDLDCGLIDQTPEVSGAPSPPAGEVLSARHLLLLGDAVEITGRIDEDLPIVCVIVLDEQGRVIGAATLHVDGVPSSDAFESGFVAVARPGAEVYSVYAELEGGIEPVFIGDVSAADIAPAGPTQPQDQDTADATAAPAAS
jgi:hypothetical protein